MFINNPTTFTAYDRLRRAKGNRITYNCFKIAAVTARTIRVAASAIKTAWKYARPVLIVTLVLKSRSPEPGQVFAD